MKKIPLKTDQNNPAIRAYKEAIEQEKKNQHIFPKGDKWIVKKIDQVQNPYVFDTKKEAEQYAVSLANRGTAIFIHNQNGTIADRRDY